MCVCVCKMLKLYFAHDTSYQPLNYSSSCYCNSSLIYKHKFYYLYIPEVPIRKLNVQLKMEEEGSLLRVAALHIKIQAENSPGIYSESSEQGNKKTDIINGSI